MTSSARDEVVLATKAGISRRTGERVTNTSRGHLLPALDASLKRLGVDHVDLWQVHVWTDETPLEETLTALDLAVTSGRASYVGISNYNGWQTAQAATWQRAVPGRATLASTQVEYSLVNRAVEHEVLPAARALGLGVLPWSPARSRRPDRQVPHGHPVGLPGRDRSLRRLRQRLPRRARTQASSRPSRGPPRASGWSPLEVALVWVRDRPGVTAPIVGARTAAQLQGALGIEELSLPPEITAALDDVSGD